MKRPKYVYSVDVYNGKISRRKTPKRGKVRKAEGVKGRIALVYNDFFTDYVFTNGPDAKAFGVEFARRQIEHFTANLKKFGVSVLLVALLSACGKETSCRILPVAGTEKPVSGTSCPYGQVVTGISGSVLTCAEVSVLCPTK